MKALDDENFKCMGQKSDVAPIDTKSACLGCGRAEQFKFTEGCW